MKLYGGVIWQRKNRRRIRFNPFFWKELPGNLALVILAIGVLMLFLSLDVDKILGIETSQATFGDNGIYHEHQHYQKFKGGK